MKVELWLIGKTSEVYLDQGISIFEKRIKHYLNFSIWICPPIKNANKLPPEQLKEQEGDVVLKQLQKEDFLLLLDEHGKMLGSVEFSQLLENRFNLATKRMIILVGGAYGVSNEIKKRADFCLSLSKMTFSHQMIRLFIVEQLYRAMTILHRQPYHNE